MQGKKMFTMKQFFTKGLIIEITKEHLGILLL